MGSGTPLTRIALSAASVADDLGYVALTDLARALDDLAEDYRVIGGHMVTVLQGHRRNGHLAVPGDSLRRGHRTRELRKRRPGGER
jgi:hypothetical protein